jgi:hypothetical protein
MRFIPILCSALMVKAIHLGTKTKTRRTKGLENVPKNAVFLGCRESKEKGIGFYFSDGTNGNKQGFYPGLNEDLYCPYGQVGDILWVRESFFHSYYDENDQCYIYKADLKPVGTTLFKWKPSIHMPKKAARIFLQIKSITVERLQDISEADARLEGVMYYYDEYLERNKFFDYVIHSAFIKEEPKKEFRFYPWDCAVESFNSLWKQINGFDSFNSNPWVWVIEFEKVEKPENFI